MKSIEDIIIYRSTSIIDALKIIDESSKQLALVIDKNNKLLGTISDGDVRRALINNISLDDSIEKIYYKTPTVANISDSREDIINICTTKKIHQVPIVNNDGSLVGLEVLDELISKGNKTNKVILMVGGLGKRLKPLTENTPKPMLQIGDKPILHTIVEKFASYGFINIVMCANYKSNMIKKYFGDGNKYGVNIEYIEEDQRMGTAGALSLLNERPSEPFFVMNGDILTNINFEHFLDFHRTNNSVASMCVKGYDYQVPYGVVKCKDGYILSIEEKPIHNFFVNAGIYILNPKCIDYIPRGIFYDMPNLFEKLIELNEITISFPVREYWLDIGHMDEFKKANKEYQEVFGV